MPELTDTIQTFGARFGAHVSSLRNAAGLSQADLADAVFGNRKRGRDVASLESGKVANPTAPTIKKYCTALNIPDDHVAALRDGDPAAQGTTPSDTTPKTAPSAPKDTDAIVTRELSAIPPGRDGLLQLLDRHSDWLQRARQSHDTIDMEITTELARHAKSRANAPIEQVRALEALALSLMVQARGGERKARLTEAVSVLRTASDHCARAKWPLRWSKLQTNLGRALHRLAKNDRAILEQSVAAFQAALEPLDAKAYPKQWQAAQSGLTRARTALEKG
ncbi:MAG: helix-turn-helix transcriptional regulator [Marinibacterium sp.]|nr:helix-turn-helix transcriptional regulator [Marinibacterium sp.]